MTLNKILGIAAVGLTLGDATLTIYGIQFKGREEGNPVVAYIAKYIGIIPAIVITIALVFFAIYHLYQLGENGGVWKWITRGIFSIKIILTILVILAWITALWW